MSTILIVDDTQDNFDLLEDAIGESFELIHAETGKEALAQTRALKPDLILLDMGLPDMDGWEVAKRLKADTDLARIPTAAVTAHAMSGDREKCLEAGCDDYVAKPQRPRFTELGDPTMSNSGPSSDTQTCGGGTLNIMSPRILVVHDIHDNLDLIVELFEGEKWNVRTADNSKVVSADYGTQSRGGAEARPGSAKPTDIDRTKEVSCSQMISQGQ